MSVDSHAHLDGERFAEDRQEVLGRAAAAGVHTILAIGTGTGPGTLDCAIQVAHSHPQANIYATVGIHPHEAEAATEKDLTELERLAEDPKVIAWGEIGLDYYYDHSPRETQRRVFIDQMNLARAKGLPIVIHCRPSTDSQDAWDDTLALLREHWAPSGIGGILHCFTSTPKHAMAAVDLGFMISFAGVLTFPKAQELREVAREVPGDRILVETDSPYLAPVPHRGKRNEPAFVVETIRKLGEVRGISTEEAAALTTANFHRFFELGL